MEYLLISAIFISILFAILYRREVMLRYKAERESQDYCSQIKENEKKAKNVEQVVKEPVIERSEPKKTTVEDSNNIQLVQELIQERAKRVIAERQIEIERSKLVLAENSINKERKARETLEKKLAETIKKKDDNSGKLVITSNPATVDTSLNNNDTSSSEWKLQHEKQLREAAVNQFWQEEKKREKAEQKLAEVQKEKGQIQLQLKEEKKKRELAEQNAAYWKSFEDERRASEARKEAERAAAKAAKLQAEKEAKEAAERKAAEERVHREELARLRELYDRQVSIRSYVTIKDKKDNTTKSFTLVSPENARARYGYVSIASPIGKALLNHRIGDVVEINTPNGRTQQLEILEIL